MIIETDRLVLRPFRETDAEDVFDYLKEPAVNCFAYIKDRFDAEEIIMPHDSDHDFRYISYEN